MRFIRFSLDEYVNTEKIERVSRSTDGYAVFHMGLDSIQTSFPFDSFINILNSEKELQQTAQPTQTILNPLGVTQYIPKELFDSHPKW